MEATWDLGHVPSFVFSLTLLFRSLTKDCSEKLKRFSWLLFIIAKGNHIFWCLHMDYSEDIIKKRGYCRVRISSRCCFTYCNHAFIQ